MGYKLLVCKEIRDSKWTKEILKEHCSSYELVDTEYEANRIFQGGEPKKFVLLARSKGEVVRDCPGTQQSYLCCGYKVINQTLNCPMDCTYCILQYYLNQPATIVYTNFDEIFRQVEDLLSRSEGRIVRIGTGELGDSLALPGSVVFAREAVKFFSSKKDVFFELKTKTDNVNSILKLPHAGNIVLSWSVNPFSVIAAEEKRASPLHKRLECAKRAVESGYLVGFHFDPMILHSGWRDSYRIVVRLIFESIPSGRIAWISLGSLRFPPATREKIARRHPDTKIIFAEMIRGFDGKLRYPRPLRVEMYKVVFEEMKKLENFPFVYLCMESQDVWIDVMGFAPESNQDFDYIFAKSLFERFPELGLTRPVKEVYMR